MRTVNVSVDADFVRIPIGIQYENEATEIVFDCSTFVTEHGSGTAQVIHKRPTESVGYPCTNVAQDGSDTTWTVTETDTSYAGKGMVQVRWYVNDVLRESKEFATYIYPSITSEDDVPTAVKSAVEEILDYVNNNCISTDELDTAVATYFDENPIPAPVTSVNALTGDVVITPELLEVYTQTETDTLLADKADSSDVYLKTETYSQDEVDDLAYGAYPTDTAGGTLASFTDGAAAPVKDMVLTIKPVQDLTGGYPSPENECAISGSTGATITKTGKNLFNPAYSFVKGQLINSEGSITSSGLYAYCEGYIPVKSDTTYVFSGTLVTSTLYNSIAFYNADKVFLSRYLPSKGTNATFTTPSGCAFVRFNCSVSYDASTIQLEEGETETDYGSCMTTVTVSWSDTAGTVYGGTLDLTTGELVSSYGTKDLGSLSYTYSSDGYFYAAVSDKLRGNFNIICTSYKTATATGVSDMADLEIKGHASANRIYIKDSSYTDTQSFKTAVTGQTICYELASPTTYQLTAQEIETLLGTNNIYIDCGEVEVTYRADPTLYIAKLTGSTEDDMTADSNITSGSYFMVGNTLYLATTAIASGETIAEGTNCTKTDLATALNALNA